MIIAGNSRYTWVIDPIDGISQYANDLTNWVVAIALLKNFEPCAGWIYQPILKDLYYAPIGDNNAYHENKNSEKKIMDQISINSDHKISKKDTIYFGSRTFQAYKPCLTKARLGYLGSLTMHAVETVLGNSLAAFSYDNKVWDICAVAEIAKRVNVQIKYISGKNVDYRKIITGKDKSLEGDLIICHKNVFPTIKSLFIPINTFDINPLKKWTLTFNHNEKLYFIMVKLLYPISLLFFCFRIFFAAISRNVGIVNVLFSIVITYYFLTCWFFFAKIYAG
ncbi:hypothetical protein FACS1894172_11710 [Spirochaetia bacterium]|nr:hypothetical protein FACS1894164_18410 [Spirochaetia bacterium]GHU33361.1 hypothetical protein FACS1894172_11710 [Spirochaetia bacterium]